MLVGIDLGTTTTSVAFLDGDTPRIIPNRFGARSTPSIVAYNDKTGIVVGEEAANSAVFNHSRTISGIKRRMGTSFPCSLGNRVFNPAEVSALILRHVLKDAAAYLGQPVTGAVIAVPAHFSELQRRATIEAGRLAGLSRVRLLNEPTAAALAYGKELSGKTAVFDFGGGTLDVSLLEIGTSGTRVHGVGGDGSLGGMDFTRAMHALFRSKGFCSTADAGGLSGAQTLATAEAAKIALSSARYTTASLSGKTVELDRSAFEREIQPLVQRALTVLRTTLDRAGWRTREINTVIFAGGTSRIPSVQREVRNFMACNAVHRISPEEIVALGAARSIAYTRKNAQAVREIIPYDIGIEIDGGRTLRLIERNTPLPVRVKRVFTTLADNQSCVEIHLLQGGYLHTGKNTSLGRFMLNGIPSAPKGTPQIEVDFTVDAEGLMTVRAKEKGGGTTEEITIPRILHTGGGQKGAERRLSLLLKQVHAERIRRRNFIDADLDEDIDDILKIAGSPRTAHDRERQRECIIALQTILNEIRALSETREENRAG